MKAAAYLVSVLVLAMSATPLLGQVAIHPAADAHVVDGSSANTNFGTSPKLQVQKSSTAGNNRMSYLTFDISTLPAALDWVKVRVYVAPPGNSSFIQLHAVPGSWFEPFITWNTKPALFEQVGVPQALLVGWREFDVTSHVRAKKAQGVSTVRFALTPTFNNTSMVEIHSRQNLISKPELQYLATPQKQLYFIHVDHLNTPRAIYDADQQLRWKWEQQEPFGVNPADENPASLGVVEFNLRFPGQYFDKETNLAYNWHRDYDAQTGRYSQSDPIGLEGGLNTYAYANGRPLNLADPQGLSSLNACANPVNAAACMAAGIGGMLSGGTSLAMNLTAQLNQASCSDDVNWNQAAIATGTGILTGIGAGALMTSQAALNAASWYQNYSAAQQLANAAQAAGKLAQIPPQQVLNLYQNMMNNGAGAGIQTFNNNLLRNGGPAGAAQIQAVNRLISQAIANPKTDPVVRQRLMSLQSLM